MSSAEKFTQGAKLFKKSERRGFGPPSVVQSTMGSNSPRPKTTVELPWLEHLWDHGNLFEIWVVRATEG